MKKQIHRDLHKKLLTLLYETNSGHIGSCLSCLNILIELFINQLRKEDRFILSKGHAAPSLYIVLNYMGKISDNDLNSFHSNGTKYPAHPPPNLDISIPFPSGSLGHGLSLSCGIAQGFKYQNKNKRGNVPKVYCLISDGECNEGQVWEAAQYASAKELNNLIVLVDNNRLQAFGKTKDVLGESSTVEKWKAFGFNVYEFEGNKTSEIKKAFSKMKTKKNNKPSVIIFNTTKGYGVSFMENKIEWHYNTLSKEQYEKALYSIDQKIKD